MHMKYVIPSSTEDSSAALLLRNVVDSEFEVLLTIDSVHGQMDIYVLKSYLKKAVDALCT